VAILALLTCSPRTQPLLTAAQPGDSISVTESNFSLPLGDRMEAFAEAEAIGVRLYFGVCRGHAEKVRVGNVCS